MPTNVTSVQTTSASKGVIFTSLIRTVVPALAGGGLGHLLALALAWLGLPSDKQIVQRVFEIVFFAIYYVVSRYLETHKNAKWGWLIGMAKAPVYSSEPAPSPDAPNEVLVAEPVDEPAEEEEPAPQDVDEPVDDSPGAVRDPVTGRFLPRK